MDTIDRDKLITENMRMVYGAVHKYYPTLAKDEDIKQVGMIGLIRAADTWDKDKSTFTTYAYQCIRNEINNELKRRKRQNSAQVLSLDYEVEIEGDKVPYSDFVPGDKDVGYVDIEAIYEKLTPRDREIYTLKQYGLSMREIADKLGVTFSCVSQHVRKIKKVIKNYVDI